MNELPLEIKTITKSDEKQLLVCIFQFFSQLSGV